MRRLLAVTISFFLILASVVFGALPANAWSGDLGGCSGFSDGAISSIRSDSRYNQNTSWVAFQRSWYGSPFNNYPAVAIVWGDPNTPTSPTYSNQILFEGNYVDNTSNNLSVPWSALLYKDVNGTLVETSAGGGYSAINFTDIYCIQDTHNVAYASYYSGATYSDTVAGLQEYSGTIDCGGEDPGAMIIEQGNNDGSAVVTPLSLGTATWEYDLTNEPYAVAISCGEEWAYSFGSVSPSLTSGNWYCDVYGSSQNYCVLG